MHGCNNSHLVVNSSSTYICEWNFIYFTAILQVVDDAQIIALTDSDRQVCHKILYDFFHGKIENPVVAGMCIYITILLMI